MSINQDDFKKIWASTSSVPEYTFSDSDYQDGWEFVGNLPPTRAMWDTLQRRNDQKMKYLQDTGSMCFDSVADMVATDIDAGQTVITKGYYSVNDGGNAFYYIRAKDVSDVEDGGSIIFLDNGNVAELIAEPGVANVKQFGAYGDGTHDDYPYIVKAIEYLYAKYPTANIQGGALRGGGIVFFPIGNYLIQSALTNSNITSNLTFLGEDNKNTIIRPVLEFVNCLAGASHTSIYFENISFVSAQTGNHSIISFAQTDTLFIRNCRFFNCPYAAVYGTLVVAWVIEGCVFKNCSRGVWITGNAGVGPSTTLDISKSWFSHCGTYGIDFSFNSQNAIGTTHIHDSIIEYCGCAISIHGNDGTYKTGKILIDCMHFEQNTNKSILHTASAVIRNNAYDSPDGWEFHLADTTEVEYIGESDKLTIPTDIKGKVKLYFSDGSIIDTVNNIRQIMSNAGTVAGLGGNGYYEIEYSSDTTYARGYGLFTYGTSFPITNEVGTINANQYGSIAVTDPTATRKRLTIRW